VKLVRLVGRGEIALRLGVTRQRVRQLEERSDFPRALAMVGRSLIWDEAEIEAWIHRHGHRRRSARRDLARSMATKYAADVKSEPILTVDPRN